MKEYKKVEVFGLGNLEECLNKYAADGWVYCGIVGQEKLFGVGVTKLHLLFERPKPTTPGGPEPDRITDDPKDDPGEPFG